jgi:hypothetical protein
VASPEFFFVAHVLWAKRGVRRQGNTCGGSEMALQKGLLIAAAVAGVASLGIAQAQQASMTFFVTSAGPGKGADLGGLSGADAHCQQLAQAAGAGAKTWRAYLSQSATGGAQTVNARERIGKGPWQNAKGQVIAKSVEELHGENNLTKQTALNEKGEVVNGSGDSPNMHDILTGTQPDGTAFAGDKDMTCRSWTSSTNGNAMVGHHDRRGLDDSPAAKSWNSSHPSRDCTQEGLRGTGGNGLFYCFATN